MKLNLKTLVLLLTVIFLSNSAYNTKIAKELVYMSAIAGESVKAIDEWSCSYCKKYNLINVKAQNAQGQDLQWFSGYSKSLEGIIISFRGSSNIPNWISNLSFKQVAYPRCSGCKVHDGFFSAWNLAKPIVLKRIQELRSLHRDAPIYVTGHSLGGALASLCASELHAVYGALHGVMTFGEPRVGNSQYSEYYHSVHMIFRVVHYADIVPHLPAKIQGFVHEGEEVWYNPAMSSYKICAWGETDECSNSLKTAYNTGDHSIDIYVKLPESFFERASLYFEEKADLFKQKMLSFKQEKELSI